MGRLVSWSRAALVAWVLVACGGETDGGGSGGTTASGGNGGSGGSGATGGTGGSTAGGTGGSGGLPIECNELGKLYAAALADAKLCSPMINSLQCTLVFPDELACPCNTYVNPDNAQAVQTLQVLLKQWASAGCVVPCPAIACIEPQGAGCELSGAGADAGFCVDFGPD